MLSKNNIKIIMGIIDDKSHAAAQDAKQHTGYSRPLFKEDKPRFNDDRIMGGSGEKKELHKPDENRMKKILDGLCQDIFFRAAYVETAENLPDCTAPITEQISKPTANEKITSKPLDSKHKQRTYILRPQLEEKQEDRRRPGRRHRIRNRSRRRR